MTHSDVLQLLALAAAVAGIGLLVFVFLGLLAALGAALLTAAPVLWLIGRELDINAASRREVEQTADRMKSW